MLSVQPQAIPQLAHIPLHVEAHNQPKDVELNEVSLLPVSVLSQASLTSAGQLGNLQDAVEPFAK
jgi:hypothetical protein